MIPAFMLWAEKGIGVPSCPVAQCPDKLSSMLHLYWFKIVRDKHLTKSTLRKGLFGPTKFNAAFSSVKWVVVFDLRG